MYYLLQKISKYQCLNRETAEDKNNFPQQELQDLLAFFLLPMMIE